MLSMLKLMLIISTMVVVLEALQTLSKPRLKKVTVTQANLLHRVFERINWRQCYKMIQKWS